MKLTMLGTGSAMARACYNTCFALSEAEGVFLVDGGGGNGIFTQLEKANIDWRCIRDIFVTHKHMDHILGVLWMIRLFCQSMADGSFCGEVRVYGHGEVISMLRQLCAWMLVPEQIGFVDSQVRLICVESGEKREILGHEVCFFDIGSDKARQFGFTMLLDGKKLSCCGDEPFGAACASFIRGSRWLMCEAFCLYAHREVFKPYQKHHSTVVDACLAARSMEVENLILYHTEDRHLAERRTLYVQEGRAYFPGTILVPEDLESIDLNESGAL